MKPDERDMLIRVVTTVEDLKLHQCVMDKKLDKHIDKDDTFLTKNLWMWFTGMLFTIILGGYIYTFELSGDCDAHANDRGIHQLINDMDDIDD